jgi:hypothetical protein
MADVDWIDASVLIEGGPSIRKSTTITEIVMEWDNEPEEPVTVTVKDPATVEVTLSVEVPEPLGANVTVVGFRLAALLVVARVTTPLKPLMPATVRIVELLKLAWTVTDCGLADRVKSGSEPTVKDTVVEWEDPPLLPVTVRAYTPAVVDEGTSIVKMEEPDPPAGTRTLFGLSATEGPKGKTEPDSSTVFEKPLMLPTAIVDVPDWPAGIAREPGLALTLKSTTLTVTVTEWDKGPLVPTTLRV